MNIDEFLGVKPQSAQKDSIDAFLQGDDSQSQTFFEPSMPEPSQPQQRKTIGERATEVGTAGGLSAALGAVSPQLFTLAGTAAAAFPVTAPAAPFLFTTGQALRGHRLREAAYGLLGGLVGESGGQVVEASGGTPFQAEVARFLGGTFGPGGC
jgi:hypothetical protein